MISRYKKTIDESYFSGTDTDDYSIDADDSIYEHCIEIRHPATYLTPKYSDTRNVLNKIPSFILNICENSFFMESYRFVYVPDDYPETDDIQTMREILKKQMNEYVKPDESSYIDHVILGSFMIHFNIKPELDENKLFQLFSKFIQKIYSLNENHRLFLNMPLYVDGKQSVQYSWLYGNDAAKQIFRSIMKNDEFEPSTESAGEFPELKWAGECALSTDSEKSIKQFKKFDFLFCRKDGALVSQQFNKNGSQNTPVAFFSHVGTDGFARFCSLRYLSTMNSKYGTIFSAQNIRFGDFSDEAEFPSSAFTIDGAANTQLLYDIVNKNTKETGKFDVSWKSGSLINRERPGIYPLLLACYMFRTPGTRQGQWYIPSDAELMMAFSKAKRVDEKLYKRYAIYGVDVKSGIGIINDMETNLGNSTDNYGQMMQIYGSAQFWSSNISIKTDNDKAFFIKANTSYSNVLAIESTEIVCEEKDTTTIGACGIAFIKVRNKK